MPTSRLSSQDASSPAAMVVPAPVQMAIQAYRNEDNFLAVFNPSKQVAYTRDIARAFTGNAPSLSIVAKAFGKSARDSWLDVQLTELAVFSGCKDKLNDYQIQGLIDIIAEEYGYLKVTELMYFFRQFKAGVYGKFYGAVDPMVITCALKDFCDERKTILKRIYKAAKERSKKTDPSYIRWLRQYRAYIRMAEFYSHNFRSADFTLEDFKDIWWLFNLGYERSDHGYSN